MSVKKYGIYLGYPPTVDLRAEGLGRHLAEFLKGAQGRTDVEFVIACPSWMRPNLIGLFEACNVAFDHLEIISPPSKPLLLSVYEKYLAFRQRAHARPQSKGLRAQLAAFAAATRLRIERRLVSTRSIFIATALSFGLFLLLAPGAAMRKATLLWMLPARLVQKSQSLIARLRNAAKPGERAEEPAVSARQESLLMRLYRLMEDSEAELVRDMLEARTDIAAWYSPTAFWPHFNQLAAPRLMCVPDVVLTDFPAGFALHGGSNLRKNFQQLEKAIGGGEYFVTYSHQTKWHTLVERYGVEPDTVFVVPHGANRLDELVSIAGFADNEAATDALCRKLFRAALQRAVDNPYEKSVTFNDEARFLFYASQFRPNKNLLSLLRAYEYLLKRRFIGHKLLLTGKAPEMSDVKRFIIEKNLQNDVLCLHGLSEQELAACYRLADLAVNPSLSEGGCPFTFTEALSVGTPVVMARIPVTEEVIIEPELQELMLFDPYDWTDMADKIEWGLHNRDLLLARQKPFYDRFAQRSWRNVVDEYVAILDLISSQREATSWAHAKVC
jgi:glycosyltransferase involved in cell wall biosynthesis